MREMISELHERPVFTGIFENKCRVFLRTGFAVCGVWQLVRCLLLLHALLWQGDRLVKPATLLLLFGEDFCPAFIYTFLSVPLHVWMFVNPVVYLGLAGFEDLPFTLTKSSVCCKCPRLLISLAGTTPSGLLL